MPSSGGVPPRRASWLEDSLHTPRNHGESPSRRWPPVSVFERRSPRNHGKYKSDPDGAMDAIATYFAS